MGFHDRSADAESHADALRFGSKERIKDVVRLLGWKPDAGIADRYQHLAIFSTVRLDGELARAIHILHRVDAVHHEIHQYLLQLHSISPDMGKIRCQLCPDPYGVQRCFTTQEN